jgi:hypothetical protein
VEEPSDIRAARFITEDSDMDVEKVAFVVFTILSLLVMISHIALRAGPSSMHGAA